MAPSCASQNNNKFFRSSHEKFIVIDDEITMVQSGNYSDASIPLNVVDGGMDAQHAIEAPRFLIGNGEGGRSRVQIEDRIPRAILADLESRGHTFAKVGRKGEVKYGYVSVAVINAAKGTVDAGAEPRRSHGAAAAK